MIGRKKFGKKGSTADPGKGKRRKAPRSKKIKEGGTYSMSRSARVRRKDTGASGEWKENGEEKKEGFSHKENGEVFYPALRKEIENINQSLTFLPFKHPQPGKVELRVEISAGHRGEKKEGWSPLLLFSPYSLHWNGRRKERKDSFVLCPRRVAEKKKKKKKKRRRPKEE